MSYKEGNLLNDATNPTVYVTEAGYVTKSYLIDVYPNLIPQAKSAGLWLWGQNNYGQLGDNTIANKSSPVQTISGGPNWKLLSCGGVHCASIKTDGTLWTWGKNDFGQLGNNTGGFTTYKSSPIQTISGGTNWQTLSCGELHTASIKTDGTLWLWGNNANSGQLGDNSIVSKSSPVQTVSGGTNWKQVSCGRIHTAAIKTDGTLWMWGHNGSGQLGDNTVAHKSSPVQTVAGGNNWKLVSSGYYSTAAIKTDGTLWLWGYNANGLLGDNTIIKKSSPIQTIAGGTNWKQVSVSTQNSAAIKTDGTLWLWGQNTYGQLGDSTVVAKSSPVQTVSGGTNWKQVICSGACAVGAIKTDGTLWMWGVNSSGQLGDNTIAHKSSPVQTVAGGNNWKYICGTTGKSMVAAIKDFSEDF